MKRYLIHICAMLVLASCQSMVQQKDMPDKVERKNRLFHHDLTVTLDPASGTISARDAIIVPAGSHGPYTLLLHEGMGARVVTPGAVIIGRSSGRRSVPIEELVVDLADGVSTFVIEYGGTINHPLDAPEKEQSRGFRQTPGIISPEGVYLAGSSFWYPLIEGEMVTFSLGVHLPPGWTAVSQGERTMLSQEGGTVSVVWESPELQDEIYLIAAEFREYSDSRRHVQSLVFLRKGEPQLAEKYLAATAQYIEMYEGLIGPYPYRKFALVENFWDTGFGMPSFTLLGPRIIRLPFIINSSYPHEILHNWWGNSVFPDYSSGNWSEGLTAYLSDHLFKEQQGNGPEYRQTTLQKYADYVMGERDFPLVQFKSRHGSPSEAVGYGKSLMFFHMLRWALGDEIFVQGLREIYRKHKFRSASFEDLRKEFEAVSRQNLETEFNQWVTRPGAPQLRLENLKAVQSRDTYVLSARIHQVQPGDPYRLAIPVAVTMEGIGQAVQSVVSMDGKYLDFSLHLPAKPQRIDIDPEFDLFRRLGRDELPPAISHALGAERMLVIVPSLSGDKMAQAYTELAQMLVKSASGDVVVMSDREVGELPSDHAVVVLGWENRFGGIAANALSRFDAAWKEDRITIGNTEVKRVKHTVVAAARNPFNEDMAFLFIGSELPVAVPGLGRKLPHYHKYSYLVFEGDGPENIAKGRWDVTSSPMTAAVSLNGGVPARAQMGKLLTREPLAKITQTFSKDRMMETVRTLSAAGMKGRGLGSPELDHAAEIIAKSFQASGLLPGGDEGSFFQEWKDTGGESGGVVTLSNVIGVLPGRKPEFAGESIVIGAHYDHLGLGWPDARAGQKGEVHHGADDNSSGVAVLMELARVLGRSMKPDRNIIFAAFTGEEAGRRGSRKFVQDYRQYSPGQFIGMINLDTVGRLGKKKLLLLGAESAGEWIHIFRGAGYIGGVEVEAVKEELDASDQVSFWEKGIPAVQLFSGPHQDYHRQTDTPDKIDGEGLVKVAGVVKEAVEYLASRERPLTPAVNLGRHESIRKEGRKVSLGTIPDFAYTGRGLRLSGVMPGSSAEISGLREGDVIVRLGTDTIEGLRNFSEALKKIVPGSRVAITIVREGNEKTVEAVVEAR